MADGPIVELPAKTKKQRGEAINFEAFRQARPDFAGRQLARIQWGGDPPDVLCLGTTGKRIGVELVQWLNQRQMAASTALHKLEDSYRMAIRSSYEQPPVNIGLIFIHAKDKTILASRDAAAFRKELYDFVARIDAEWLKNDEWNNPQGYSFTDFAGYPTLATHLEDLDVHARGWRFSPQLGADWLTFRAHGGAFTPEWMRDALLDNVTRKIDKYAKPNNKVKLTEQCLEEFCLLAYLDDAIVHNTPYHGINFGFREIGAILSRALNAKPHPFDKVFLFSPTETAQVFQAWPQA